MHLLQYSFHTSLLIIKKNKLVGDCIVSLLWNIAILRNISRLLRSIIRLLRSIGRLLRNVTWLLRSIGRLLRNIGRLLGDVIRLLRSIGRTDWAVCATSGVLPSFLFFFRKLSRVPLQQKHMAMIMMISRAINKPPNPLNTKPVTFCSLRDMPKQEVESGEL